MKIVSAILVVGVVFLVGCTMQGVKYPGYKDCEADDTCIRNAIKNNCENAFIHVRIREGEITPVGSLEKIVTNRGTFCELNITNRNLDDQKIFTRKIDFQLPIEQCPSVNLDLLKTTSGTCVSTFTG